MGAGKIPIYGELVSKSDTGKLLDSDQVYDTKNDGRCQSDINSVIIDTVRKLDNLPLRLEIEFSLGPFLGPGETGLALARVTKGFDDVTETMDTWIWTRTSGSELEDTAWNIAHQGYTWELPISYSDLGNAEDTGLTIFTLITRRGEDSVTQTLEI